jgi:hypothetical protein
MNVTLMLAASAATVVALLARLRRSRGGERQQLKWLCYAGALTVSGNSGSVPHLISRTVVYGLLTALVTAVYLAIVCVRMSHVPSDADALIAYQQQLGHPLMLEVAYPLFETAKNVTSRQASRWLVGSM